MNRKSSYCMSNIDLKALKKSIEYVKKLDFYNSTEQKRKTKKFKKVA